MLNCIIMHIGDYRLGSVLFVSWVNGHLPLPPQFNPFQPTLIYFNPLQPIVARKFHSLPTSTHLNLLQLMLVTKNFTKFFLNFFYKFFSKNIFLENFFHYFFSKILFFKNIVFANKNV